MIYTLTIAIMSYSPDKIDKNDEKDEKVPL